MIFLYTLLFIGLMNSTLVVACQAEEKLLPSSLVQLNSLSLQELEQKAQEGDAYAQYTLAVTVERQRSPNSEQAAYGWYSKAAEKLTEAQYMLGRWHERKQEWQAAFNWYYRAANSKVDNHAAQFKVVQFYERGVGIEQSNSNAFYWCSIINRPYPTPYVSFDEEYNKLLHYARINGLLKAAYFCENNMVEHKPDDIISYYLKILEIDKSNIPSLLAVAHIYESANKIKIAKNYYQQAADLQAPEALHKMALFVYEEQDYKKTWEFITKACEQDYAPAHYAAGIMREYNRGLKPSQDNERLAYESYKQAAAKGHEKAFERLKDKAEKDPHACYILGRLYEEGIQGQQDMPQALVWYKKACAQKHAEAFYALACHYKKEGDMEEAALNLGQAAHYGYSKADYELGEYQEKGLLRKIKEARDILLCYIEASRCYKAAYEKGYAKAQAKVVYLKDILEDLKLLKEPDFMNSLFQPFQAHIGQLECPLDFFYWISCLADLLKLRCSEKIQMTVYYLVTALLECKLDHNQKRTFLKDIKRLLESALFSNGEFNSKTEAERITLLVNFFKDKLSSFIK